LCEVSTIGSHERHLPENWYCDRCPRTCRGNRLGHAWYQYLKMSDERTITVSQDSGSGREATRHYNVDNLAYLEVEGGETKSVLSLLLGVILLLLGGLGAVLALVNGGMSSGIGLFGLIFLLGLLLIAYYYSDSDEIELGTTTRREQLEVHDASSLESEFVERTSDTITIEGTDDKLLSSTTYRYHFVPDNIISIERQQSNVTLPEWAVIGGTFFIPLILVYFFSANPGKDAGITAAVCGVVAVVLFIGFANKDDGILIESQSGDRRSFVMSPDDARSVLSTFGQR